jgi:hypothetical protein
MTRICSCFAGIVFAFLGAAWMLSGFGATSQAADCNESVVLDAQCVTAHRETPTLGAGPRCDDVTLPDGTRDCRRAPNSVCAGVYWDNAVPGRCMAPEPGTSTGCNDEKSVTNVTIYKFAADCRWSDDGICGCRPTYLKDPDTGEYISDDKEVCNCDTFDAPNA